METVEKARLGGFFEGEGHIGISRARSHGLSIHGYYYSFLQATMTNTEKLLLEPYLFFGGRIIQSHKNYTAYRWYISSSSATNFLQTILPYLRGNKAKQVPLAIEYQKIKSRIKNYLTEDEALRLDQLGYEINSLNSHKGRRVKQLVR